MKDITTKKTAGGSHGTIVQNHPTQRAIRTYRWLRKLSQAQLGKAAGLTRATITNSETRTLPPLAVLERIAVALGVPLAKLVDGSSEKLNAERPVKLRAGAPQKNQNRRVKKNPKQESPVMVRRKRVREVAAPTHRIG